MHLDEIKFSTVVIFTTATTVYLHPFFPRTLPIVLNYNLLSPRIPSVVFLLIVVNRYPMLFNSP